MVGTSILGSWRSPIEKMFRLVGFLEGDPIEKKNALDEKVVIFGASFLR